MKRILFSIFSLIPFFSIFAQQGQSLEYEFDKARALLAQRNTVDAIEALRKIYIDQPNNANINFLMGAAYTESPGNDNEAVFHLKKAMQDVSVNYIVGSFKEERAPIHVYYYLALALVQLDRCAEANRMLEKLKEFNSRLDKYFIDEATRNMEKCPFDADELVEDWSKPVPEPEGYNSFELKMKISDWYTDSAALAEKGLLVQRLEYTTGAPLYGVQIGSNKNPSPISNYGRVRNVDVFVDNDGLIRYVVGHFSYVTQAESLLKSLLEKGYEDAFIVNVNDERKYSNELISYNNINVRSGVKGKVEFYIQLGAFTESIPDSIISLYTKIDDIQEIKYQKYTLLLVGEFDAYQDCEIRSAELKAMGINNFFIVAFNNRKKVPLQEAINYTR